MPSLKVEELKEIQELYSYNINYNFIETGSYMGSTIDNIKNNFKNIYTIELNENLYNYCKKKFENDKNINCLKGESYIKLQEILKDINNDTIFFLDGHYSGNETSKGIEDVPLLRELEVINKNFKNKGIIIIDDLRLFGSNGNEDWSKITKKNILEKIDNIKFNLTIEKYDKFVIYI
tara:strand:- start:142 stop:672 length:531 start_codon:yes stop_codon:yes gene_type:complete